MFSLFDFWSEFLRSYQKIPDQYHYLEVLTNVIYLIYCKCCGKQYVWLSTGYKEIFRIPKNDINTGKVRCCVENYLLNICRSAASKFEYLKVQLIWVLKSTVIEKGAVQNDDGVDKVFWEKEKY